MADTYTVLAGALRLRKTAPEGPVLTILPKGHSVKRIGQQRVAVGSPALGVTTTWLQVETSIHERDFRGYVHADYVMPSIPEPHLSQRRFRARAASSGCSSTR